MYEELLHSEVPLPFAEIFMKSYSMTFWSSQLTKKIIKIAIIFSAVVYHSIPGNCCEYAILNVLRIRISDHFV